MTDETRDGGTVPDPDRNGDRWTARRCQTQTKTETTKTKTLRRATHTTATKTEVAKL